jgi:hypothetical protein
MALPVVEKEVAVPNASPQRSERPEKVAKTLVVGCFGADINLLPRLADYTSIPSKGHEHS